MTDRGPRAGTPPPPSEACPDRQPCCLIVPWIRLSQTQGRGKLDTRHHEDQPVKNVFGKPLWPDWEELLDRYPRSRHSRPAPTLTLVLCPIRRGKNRRTLPSKARVTSTPSHLIRRMGIKTLQLESSILSPEAPVDLRLLIVPIRFPGRDLVLHPSQVWNAAVEALSAQSAEFNLGHVQAVAVFRRVVDFEPFRQAPRLRRRERRLEGLDPVRVQIIYGCFKRSSVRAETPRACETRATDQPRGHPLHCRTATRPGRTGSACRWSWWRPGSRPSIACVPLV